MAGDYTAEVLVEPEQIARRTGKVDLALRSLAVEYKGQTGIEATLEAIISPLEGTTAGTTDGLEDVFFSLYLDRWLDTAIGKQLDELGDLLDLTRGANDDDEYRRLLRVQILVLSSEGTIEELIEIARRILNDDTKAIHLFELGNAALLISISGGFGDAATALVLFAMLNDAKTGGVWLGVMGVVDPTATPFIWDDLLNPNGDGAGFDDLTAPGAGGVLATLFAP